MRTWYKRIQQNSGHNGHCKLSVAKGSQARRTLYDNWNQKLGLQRGQKQVSSPLKMGYVYNVCTHYSRGMYITRIIKHFSGLMGNVPAECEAHVCFCQGRTRCWKITPPTARDASAYLVQYFSLSLFLLPHLLKNNPLLHFSQFS